MAYEWFISYRRKTGGEQQARQVADILTKYVGKGKVFYDRESIREGNWREQIENALSTAEHFVLLVNEASAAEKLPHTPGSYYYEIEYALKSEKLKKDRITPIIYDNESLKTLQTRVNGLDAISEDQRVTFVGEYGFAFEERLCKHFGFTTAERKIYNITFPQNLIPREDMLKKLRDKFDSHNCVVVSGIGGSGKTSLAYLYAKEQPFDNIAWITVNGKIEDVFVDKMAGLIFDLDDYIKFVQIPDREYKRENIKNALLRIAGKNFLVLDINTNNEEIKREIESELYNYLPAGNWETLVLTRTHPVSDDGFFEVVEMDKMAEDDAQELFKSNWKRQGIVFTKEQLTEITKELHLHPLLIEQTAIVFSKGHEKTAEQIIKKIKGNSVIKNERTKTILGSLVAKGKTERQDIYTYLINLCNIENLSKEEIDFLAVYVTWPDEPIDYEVIETLLSHKKNIASLILSILSNNSNQKTKHLVKSLNEVQARQYIKLSYEHAKDEEEKQIYKKIIDSFNDEDSNSTLDSLVEKGILSRNDNELYSIHSLIADVLREQIDITTCDYTEYFMNIEDILVDPEKSFVIHKYSKYIASSFVYYGICREVDLFSRFFNELQQATVCDPVLFNLPEPEYSMVLKTLENKAEPKQLALLYNVEAGVEKFINKPSDAIIHLKKALKIMDSLEENEENLHLKGGFLNNLAFIEDSLNDFKSAQKHYEDAMEIKRKLPQTPNNLNSLVSSLNNLAMHEEKLKDFKSAQKHYEEALVIKKQLPKTLDNLHWLAGYITNLAILEERKLGDLNAAKNHFEEALQIRIYLPKTPDNLNNIANILTGLGEISVKIDSLDSAKAQWEKALEIAHQTNDEEWINSLKQRLSLLEKAPEILKIFL